MYRLATGYSITDRQTDDSVMPIADHTACMQYDRLLASHCRLSVSLSVCLSD